MLSEFRLATFQVCKLDHMGQSSSSDCHTERCTSKSGQHLFSVMGQIVSILGFVAHMVPKHYKYKGMNVTVCQILLEMTEFTVNLADNTDVYAHIIFHHLT